MARNVRAFGFSGYEDDVFSRGRAQMMLWRNLQTRMLFALAALVLLTVVSYGSASAAYPDRVVKIVVPFAPGGGTDVVARTLAQEMAEDLGAGVIIENRPGAGNII